MKHQIKAVVFLLVTRNGEKGQEILLQKRQNTGYMDGMYDFGCSGHIEVNETAMEAIIREAKEEIGIEITMEDLEFYFLIHNPKENYMKLFFQTKTFLGTPTIMEPEKCSELIWTTVDFLPDCVIPTVIEVLKKQGQLYSETK